MFCPVHAGAPTVFEAAPDQVHPADKLGDEAICGPAIDIVWICALRDPSIFHDGNAIRERQCLFLVVRHVDCGNAQSALQRTQLQLHLFTEFRVEIRQRLVQEKNLGLDHDGSRERNALLLAAAQLARESIPGPSQPNKVQGIGHPVRGFASPDLAHPQAEANVFGHGHVWKQGVILEHHSDVPPVRRHIRDVIAEDLHGASVRFS